MTEQTQGNSESSKDDSLDTQLPYYKVASTKRTAFITKLFSMVNDQSINHLITWSSPGDRVVIFNNLEFARQVLPAYFKHCNWASFVRQLNMYDFHKVNDSKLIGSNLNYFEFRHPLFHKEAGSRLHKIKRKNPKRSVSMKLKYANLMDLNTCNDSGEEDNEEDNEEDEEDNEEDEDDNEDEEDKEDEEGEEDEEEFDHHRENFVDQNDLNEVIYQSCTFASSSSPQESLHSLVSRTQRLEGKTDKILDGIHCLMGTINFQTELLTKLHDTMKVMEAKFSSHETPEQGRKPRRIHELLIPDSPKENEAFHPDMLPESSTKRRKISKVP